MMTTTNFNILEGCAPPPVDYDVVNLVRCKTISLWMLLCGTMVPPTTQLFSSQKSTRRSALSFLTPQPWLPIPIAVTVVIFSSNLGIHGTDNQQHIVLGDLGDSALKFLVPVILVLLLSFVCWSITLYDGHFTVFGVEASSDNSITYRFPFCQGFCLFLEDYESHAVYVLVYMTRV